MLVELTCDKETQLNKWFRVRELNGIPQQGLYVRFALACDSIGNSLHKIPKTTESIYVEMQYNGNNYP